MVVSFWHRVLDLISPRLCVVCGRRLTVSEETICARCNLHLPRTGFWQDPYENEMAKLFWHQIPIERAAALFYYEAHSETANILYELKYKNHPEIGEVMGRLMAKELQSSGFFDGIDGIVPIPLAKKRQRQRGYNQSLEIARGISEVTGLPIYNKVARRSVFEGSQTSKGRWERNENVEHVFELKDAAAIQGKHLLVVDDVVTTGATVIACAKELCKADNVRISVLALGLAKS
ncbi:MAG: ComF family protein [Prevotella sp.]|nr:ComF family protein [Prevotella sp.]